MLAEVYQEVMAGRIEGPFQSPDGWPKATVDAASVGLRRKPLPPGPVYAARACSVTQPGLTGNAKPVAARITAGPSTTAPSRSTTAPNTTTSRSTFRLLRQAQSLGLEQEIRCQDLADAYRAYPVQEPGGIHAASDIFRPNKHPSNMRTAVWQLRISLAFWQAD